MRRNSAPGLRTTASLFIALLAIGVASNACQRNPTEPSRSGSSVGPPPANLVTIAEVTIAQVTQGYTATSNNMPGQSITIGAGPSYNNIRFNWDTSQEAIGYKGGGPAAFGTCFILTSEYLGLPHDLGPSTPGYVTQSEGIWTNQYVFPASVALKGGTKYWFYTNTGGSFVGSFAESTYDGGDMYIAPDLGSAYPALAFRKAPASWRVIDPGPPMVYYKPPEGTYIDANFKLQGVPIGQ